MIDIDLKDKNQLYQLLGGILGFIVILSVCLIIMKPFFPAILLSTIFTLSTWPAFIWLNHRLGDRPVISSTVMTLILAVFFIMPICLIGTSLTESLTKAYSFTQETISGNNSDTLKTNLENLPYVGQYLEHGWNFIEQHKEPINITLKKYAAPTSQKIISMGASIGRGLLDISLGVLLTYFFFRHGKDAATRLGNLIDKFSGERGRQIFSISKNTLTSVIYGILGTAVAQALLAALGLLIAGVPGVTFLAFITFFLSLIPMGPPLIWIPAALWLYATGKVTMALFLALWGLLVISSVDNFLKPYFISMGSNLPLALVLLGVLGGVVAFGFIGVFIGPTFLAVAYNLIIDWSTSREKNNEEVKQN